VAEWLKAADCKSALSEYVGSNPALSTIYGVYMKKLIIVLAFIGALCYSLYQLINPIIDNVEERNQKMQELYNTVK
jgi:flagellar biogenesis protein FliO